MLVGASVYGIAVMPMMDQLSGMGALVIALPFISAVLIARYRYLAGIIQARTAQMVALREQDRLDAAARQVAAGATEFAEETEILIEAEIQGEVPRTASPPRPAKRKLTVETRASPALA